MARVGAVGADLRMGPPVFITSFLLCGAVILWAQPPDDCLGVILLDLAGDGLRLSDIHYPARFDIDGDTVAETLSWTAVNHDEAFLWLLSSSRPLPVDGSDLFTSTPARHPGEGRQSAFLKLSRLDHRHHGGNGDGLLSAKDDAWADLRLWIDRDHDGRARHTEISDLESWRILRIHLDYEELHGLDGNMNRRLRASRFVRKRNGARQVSRVTEVCFHTADPEDLPDPRTPGDVLGGPRSWHTTRQQAARPGSLGPSVLKLRREVVRNRGQ